MRLAREPGICRILWEFMTPVRGYKLFSKAGFHAAAPLLLNRGFQERFDLRAVNPPADEIQHWPCRAAPRHGTPADGIIDGNAAPIGTDKALHPQQVAAFPAVQQMIQHLRKPLPVEAAGGAQGRALKNPVVVNQLPTVRGRPPGGLMPQRLFHTNSCCFSFFYRLIYFHISPIGYVYLVA